MKIVLLFIALSSLYFSGCGQTGPLYLPGQPAPIKVPKEKPQDVEELEQLEPPETLEEMEE
ncbi:MAG: hypothetical protein Kow0065_00470 [Methylomicrobium sp.]